MDEPESPRVRDRRELAEMLEELLELSRDARAERRARRPHDKGLPRLLDRKQLADELNVTLATAERIMRKIDKVTIGRRVFVKEADVREFLRCETAAP